ncbi:SPARC-related modular calcium-binding protein 1 [Tetranychus urticae]|uniref:Thyroglobulin type-1 domain-containing protein n=1 Tax=Tetranychus urticae TaxID=32264 RepID=T1L212_TETUR|nr:SPARC-related modular calcium-binding protein 1 [Tetranychus urticae]
MINFTKIVLIITIQVIGLSSISLSSPLSSSVSSNCSILPGCESEGPLCSSEGKTYKTKCDLLVDLCKRPGILIVAKYPCSTCLLERSANLAVKLESDHQSGKEILIPECDLTKGLYKAQQCHKETGYCWCVDVNNGKPIWKTSAKGDKASTDCDILARKINRKRRPRRDKKKCTRAEKNELIKDLINLFSTEYEKQFNQQKADSQTLIKYKFASLDINKDEQINRREMKDLRESVNRKAGQNNCAASFFKVLDNNSDKKISLSEWTSFFTNQRPVNDRSDIAESRKVQARPSDVALWSSNISSVHGLLLLNQKPKSETQDNKDEDTEDEGDSDDNGFSIESIAFKPNCSESRQIALKNSANFSHSKTLIPSCNNQDSFLYNEVQCHELPGFCFCVRPSSGQLIPGISSKLPAKPDCSQRMIRKRLSNPRKGCFPQKALRFKHFLIKNFREEYKRENPNDRNFETSTLISWKFNKIDRDANRLIETSEWAGFELSLKSLISRLQNFRRCARNFVQRDCDSNQDGKIEWKEWKSCIYAPDTRRDTSHSSLSTTTAPLKMAEPSTSPTLDSPSHSPQTKQKSQIDVQKRKGRNPFLPILKGD